MKLGTYVVRRLLAMVPTLLGIITLTFFLLQLMPGGPVERAVQQIQFGGGGRAGGTSAADTAELTRQLNAQYGFDQPIYIRYVKWLSHVVRLDFGQSNAFGRPVWDVIRERFPVSLQFGIASLLFTYTISVALGAVMATGSGTARDYGVGFVLVGCAAVPPFAFAISGLVLFAGGHFFDWFPLGYLVSEDYAQLSSWGKFTDRVYHFALPLICYLIGGFASLAYLARNSFLEQFGSDYVRVARSKGLTETTILFRHVLRNALLPVVTGIGGFVAIFLSGSLLIETIFQLDGIGRLGFRALASRDYNLVMGLMVLQSAALLVGNLVSDLVYLLVDPRIDFAKGGV